MDFHQGGQRPPQRDESFRVRGKSLRRLMASPDAISGFDHIKGAVNCSNTDLKYTCFNGSEFGESSFVFPALQNLDGRTDGRSTEMLVGEGILTEWSVSKNSHSRTVIEELMGLDKLLPQKNHDARTNSLSTSFFKSQEFSKAMDSSTAVTGSNDIAEGDLSLVKPQNSTSRKHTHEVPQQEKMQSADVKPFNVNVLKNIKNSFKNTNAVISEVDSVYNSKWCSYQAIHRPSGQFNDLSSSNKSLFSSSSESVKGAATKKLPKRLKITDQRKEFGQKSFSSAGEVRSRDFGSSVVLKIINEKSARAKESSSHVLSTLNRKDVWKNGKFENLPLPRHPLFSSTASRGVAQSNRQMISDERHYSIKDIINLRARNLLKAPVRSLLKSDKNETKSDDTNMNFAPSNMHEIQSHESCKPDRIMSPVSVLELQFKEDNIEYNMHDSLFKSNNVFVNGYDVISGNTNEAKDPQLFLYAAFSEDEFMDNEERDYSYLLDMLIISGIHGVNQEMLYNGSRVLRYPVDDFEFEKLEKKYSKLVSWSRVERRLFFNRINTILGELLAPCMDLHPWVHHNRKLAPLWGSEGLVEKVWEILIREQNKLSVGKAEEKVLDGIWLDLGNDVNEMGMEIEKIVLKELLEELVSEFI